MWLDLMGIYSKKFLKEEKEFRLDSGYKLGQLYGKRCSVEVPYHQCNDFLHFIKES